MHSNSFWSHLIRSDRSWSQTENPNQSHAENQPEIECWSAVKFDENIEKDFGRFELKKSFHRVTLAAWPPYQSNQESDIPLRICPEVQITLGTYFVILWFFEIFVVFSRIFLSTEMVLSWVTTKIVRNWEKNYEIE